ncbi:hypothetical protein [Nocardia sp. NPDC058666]|uniref:hypothetical protein n=1 Tax=Nocardia sp. NPDC058666 TaxID=3346587 RepID=UPI003660EE20
MNSRIKQMLAITGVAVATSSGLGFSTQAAAAPGDQVTAGKIVRSSTNGRLAVVEVDYACNTNSPRVRHLAAQVRRQPTVDPKTPPENQRVAILAGTSWDVTCDGNRHRMELVVRIVSERNTLPNMSDGPVTVSVVLYASGGSRQDGTSVLASYDGQGTATEDKSVDHK